MGTTEEVTPVVEYVFQLINRLKSCQELAIEKMEETKIKRKAWYDKNAIKREFSEGDLVLVLKMNRPNKLSVQWKEPGKIEKKNSETNYVVSFNNNTESNQVFHVNMLKPYYKRAEFINMINSRAKEDLNELEKNFPCIDSNPNIFDFDEIAKHRKTHLVEHDIELINDVPIRTKPYRMSARQTDLLQEEIRKMLKYQVIEIGESDYASPMILVETPGRDPRPCIDYRKLNEIPLTPKAQRLAAFTTSFGTYRPLRLGKRSPAQLKVQTILDFPVPRTKTQVRAFSGIAGYYRQYIPMFSSLAAPLTELLKGKSKKGYINWTSECQESFVQLKEKLSTNPVLYAPDFKRQFILQTDTSDTGIGIVLAQRNDRGEEHPILYLSKKFSDAERRFTAQLKKSVQLSFMQ
ncbi:retrovirus-related Pol polyprotein from transposon 297 [Trichonephila clavipes]|nr:retrovirus-related Pol polyprotein from transposon 297 [Trichonephila clavipes]